MSVNSAMTAIADKIRTLLGTTGKMGLDAMATNLTTVQNNVTAAFSAIGDKGGTVPSSKDSGNLVSAINSIPAGVTVRKTSGSFSTGSSGKATVTCGFKPDLVFVEQGYTYTYNNASYPVSASFSFAESQTENVYTTFWNIDDVITDFFVKRTSTGFSVEAVKYSGSWQGSGYQGSFEYVAVKYT